MDEAFFLAKLPFRAHLIWISGPQRDPTVRVLLVATAGAQTVYEGLGSWSKFKHWIDPFPGIDIPEDRLTIIQKFLARNQFATIQEVRASLFDLEFLGLHRADS